MLDVPADSDPAAAPAGIAQVIVFPLAPKLTPFELENTTSDADAFVVPAEMNWMIEFSMSVKMIDAAVTATCQPTPMFFAEVVL